MVAGAAGLALLVLAVYWQVRTHSFVEYDTSEYLKRNGMVLRGLTWDGFWWGLTSFHAANWHPLTWWSHMLDVELYGFDARGQLAPAGHHLTNVALHAGCTLLVFALFLRWTQALWKSALVAALFGLHPAHVESVAWAVERKDVLAAFFGLLFLHAWTSWTRRGGLARYALAWSLLALGLMAKSMLVTLPCVLLLVDVWPLARTSIPLARRVLEKLPFVPLILASAWLTSAAQKSWGAMSALDHIALGPRFLNALWAWPNYAWKLLCPVGLLPWYPWRDRSDQLGVVAACAFVLVASGVGAWLLRKRAPYVFVGWAWFVGMLVPVIGLVQVGDQSMADRYTYLPSIGFFAALVWGASALLARTPIARQAGVALGAGVVLVASVLCWKQVGLWKDTESLARHGLAVDPTNSKMHSFLGFVYSEQALTNPAEGARLNALATDEFRAAVASKPTDVYFLDQLAYLLMRQAKYAEAEPILKRALELEPNHSQVLNHMGGLCDALNRVAEAEGWLRRSIASDPNNALATNNLGWVLERQSRFPEAEAMFRRALELLPNYGRAALRLGVVLRKQQRPAEALAALQRATQLGLNGFDATEAANEMRALGSATGKAQ